MYKSKKLILFSIFMMLTLTIQGCDPIGGFFDFFGELFNPNLIIIRGTETISGEGEVFTIPKGTTVEFRDTVLGGDGGFLWIKDGAMFIAQGTADEPIVFQRKEGSETGIIQFEANASTDSIIEYCEFMNLMWINIINNLVIQYNKFVDAMINLNGYAEPIIQYNTIQYNTIVHCHG